MNMHYLWWPATAVILYSIHAYASFLNKGSSEWKTFLLVCVIGTITTPLWALISKISKNLLFDAMLFDLLLLLTYACTFFILEHHYLAFKGINYLGIVLVILGIILLKQ